MFAKFLIELPTIKSKLRLQLHLPQTEQIANKLCCDLNEEVDDISTDFDANDFLKGLNICSLWILLGAIQGSFLITSIFKDGLSAL